MTNARDKANIPVLNFQSKGIDDNADATAITINSSEQVGIGTSAIDGKLHLDDGTSTKLIIEKDGGGHASVTFHNDGASTSYIQLDASEDMVHYGGSGVNQIFYASGSERMRVTSSGLGVGTTSPISKVNIEATKTTALSSMNDFLTIGLTVDDNTAYNEGVGGGIAFRGKRQSGGQQTVFGAIVGTKRDNSNDGYNGNLRFFTNNNGNGIPTEHLRITSAGLVGIGETAPLGKLHVKSADSGASANSGHNQVVAENSGNSGMSILSGTSSNGAICFGDSGNDCKGYVNYAHNGDHLDFGVNATEKLRITSDGDVGIGLTNPAVKLSVFDSSTGIIASFATTGNRSLDISSADNGAYAGAHWNRDINSAGGIHTWSVEGNERVRVDSSGNLSIGTTDTSHIGYTKTLNITSSNNTAIALQGGTSGVNAIFFGDGTGNPDFKRGVLYYYHSDNSMRFRTNDAEHMRILSNGRIGMNRTAVNGAAILDISHPGSSEYGLTLDSSNTSGTQYHLDIRRGGTQAGYLVSTSATAVNLANSSDERLKENIENSGSALQDIKDLKVRQFDWKDNIDTHKDFGFVAQELHSIIPEAVAVGSDELDDNGKPKQSWGVDYSHIVPRLVKAVQEQQTKIESLEAEVTALKNQP